MSDNLKIRQPLDAKRINMNQAHEVAYWTRTLGISELYLRIVVNFPTSYSFTSLLQLKNFIQLTDNGCLSQPYLFWRPCSFCKNLLSHIERSCYIIFFCRKLLSFYQMNSSEPEYFSVTKAESDFQIWIRTEN